MSANVSTQIGNRIKELREAAQLTQAELAALSLKSVETISNFERGKTMPSLLTLEQLAIHLRVPMHAFFTDDTIKPNMPPEDIAIQNKARLLSRKDKQLLLGIMDLLTARSAKKS